jgi:hypothetical protein
VQLNWKRRQKFTENYKLKNFLFTKLHWNEKVRKFDMDTASSKHGRKKEVTKNFGKEN